jgi:hypothetical protein
VKIFANNLICLLVFVLFFFFVKTGFAASVSSQTFTFIDEIPLFVKLSVSAIDGTSYYLRGVFSKEGSTNYCGLTWNDTTFYSGPYSKNEGWKNFLKVTIKDNGWQGEMKVKIDTDDSGCRDSGTYMMKVERFTESGSGSFDPQPTLALTFVLPTPTLLPTSTPRPTAMQQTAVPTKISTPTKASISMITQNTLQPTDSVVYTVTQKPNPHFIDYKSSEEAVLGDATGSAHEKLLVSLIPTTFPVKVLGSSTSLWPFIFSTIGGGILVLCAILSIRIYKQGKIL